MNVRRVVSRPDTSISDISLSMIGLLLGKCRYNTAQLEI